MGTDPCTPSNYSCPEEAKVNKLFKEKNVENSSEVGQNIMCWLFLRCSHFYSAAEL